MLLLKVLREAGLIHTRVQGTRRMVTLRYADLDQRFPGLLAMLRRPAGQPPVRNSGPDG